METTFLSDKKVANIRSTRSQEFHGITLLKKLIKQEQESTTDTIFLQSSCWLQTYNSNVKGPSQVCSFKCFRRAILQTTQQATASATFFHQIFLVQRLKLHTSQGNYYSESIVSRNWKLLVNPLQPNYPFLYLWFSDVFRGCRNETFG